MQKREDRFELVKTYVDRAFRTSVTLSMPVTLFSVATIFYTLRTDYIGLLPTTFSVVAVYPLLLIWLAVFRQWIQIRNLYEEEIFRLEERQDDTYLRKVFHRSRTYEMYCLIGVAASLFTNVMILFFSAR